MANSRFGGWFPNNIGTALSSHMSSLVGRRDRMDMEEGEDEDNNTAKRNIKSDT